MQMNPGVKSLEAELERAFFRAGGINRNNFGNLQKVLLTSFSLIRHRDNQPPAFCCLSLALDWLGAICPH